ncbi:MAG: DNA helicase [Acidiphilium sp. 37-64-53]|uniref:ATP-dependent DNA helicase n=1 Tax=Acidiphilium TaxID=522 RepID=UPI000BDC43C7|nr:MULTISPECIES: ATP-dependent DNA helicase [Acidiphilium]OYW04175.1 MAG: DNA helicase [Acidiphilium sp. 37-64-53]OZB31109.1 MAG: DNA helicase [Acidiphilium sp. 34-64-41]HQT83423.1 ATP-dependent DNA helicase [Acidiphilium rubrum]
MNVPPRLLLPDAPSLVTAHGRAAILTAEGELLTLDAEAARAALRGLPPPIVIHAPATLKRLGTTLRTLDLLELFAFVMPAQPLAPTPAALARALDMEPPQTIEAAAAMLPDFASALLTRLAQGRTLRMNRHAAGLAALMGSAGWPWAKAVAAALDDAAARPDRALLRLWSILPEWDDEAPRPPPSSFAVAPDAARARLADLLGDQAEQRPAQSDYASAATAAFAPAATEGAPHCVLAEAGTGTGKTLGYLAPASLWAERNQGAVWISTYTRHLQRQIEQELARLEPDPVKLRNRVVLRKGRENYLCLLNYEDAVNNAGANLVALGLIARWALVSNDHDVAGGDLPGWFAELFGTALLPQIADRRGECIHGACPHFKRCTIEHVIRRARGADLVIANHALVMAQAVWGGLDDNSVPTRYVFDEGHHLFDAADSAFSAELSGIEMAELRRWLLGAEGGRSRARGIAPRIADLVEADETLAAPLEAALIAARVLPGSAFFARLGAAGGVELDSIGTGTAEAFLSALVTQARARAKPADRESSLDFEVDLHPVEPALADAAAALERALARLETPLKAIRERLLARLDEEAATIEERDRQRIEAMARSLRRRALDQLAAWRRMLAATSAAPPAPGERPRNVLFIRLGRDAALLSHLLDPTEAFAEIVATPAHGLLITSATLRDNASEAAPEAGWRGAEARSGARYLPNPAIRAGFASPFDYPAQTRIFVVRDAPRDNIEGLAAAFRALFLASGGGALGLFTAISRLRAVQSRIAPALEAENIPLYAQHVDVMNNATLVDVFRAEQNACLLGTDAMRDGVDVPGNALRLVVFERTPWPRPDILHRVRRAHLADGDAKAYDDAIVRLRLRQGFGRLIRRASDRGVFVLLDRAFPSRLESAFPPDVIVQRIGLAETVASVAAFFAPPNL